MKANIIDDLSKLSTVPEKALAKLIRKMVYCICESIEEDLLQNKDEMVELDIGIGTLYIKYCETNVNANKYHFEPSDYLKRSLKDTLENKQNVLEDALNESLIDKFVEVYKDIC